MVHIKLCICAYLVPDYIYQVALMRRQQKVKQRTPTFLSRNTENSVRYIDQSYELRENNEELRNHENQKCILSESSMEKLNDTRYKKQKKSQKTYQRGHSTPRTAGLSQAIKRQWDYSNQKNNRESTRDKTSKRPKSSFQATFIESGSLEDSRRGQRIVKIENICQKLAYTIGHLKAELKEVKRQRDEQKQKRVKETRYLGMMAEKYKAEAEKFKKLLGKANISVQTVRVSDCHGAGSGPRYSHI